MQGNPADRVAAALKVAVAPAEVELQIKAMLAETTQTNMPLAVAAVLVRLVALM